uniref:Phosphatidic acid phosphatase type 2/haloperoxidase domain-containing protein n=1 Tax=Physcomitrium patens TaxID=3218 RepID=A0A2K1IH97_PHYPA|nr:hypothetical protein PHYPA_029245 [Physcomitrium patens]
MVAHMQSPAPSTILTTRRSQSLATRTRRHSQIFSRRRQSFGRPAQPIVFTPFLRTPPHPEYPSTHSTAAGSWAKVLARYLSVGISQHISSYSVATEGYPLPLRTYNTLEAAAVEVGVSRIYGGVHFRKAVEDGIKLGVDIGDYVWDHFEKEFGDL